MKYTLDYCKANKIGVRITSIEEGEKVAALVPGKHENWKYENWKYYLNSKINSPWYFIFNRDYDLYIVSHNKNKNYTLITAEQFIKDNTEMKEIPQYFVVKRDDSPEWEKYINWLNKKYKRNWVGRLDCYYGYDGNLNFNGTDYYYSLSSFENNPTAFESAKEFMELVRQTEMTEINLSKGWIVECKNQEETEIVANFIKKYNGKRSHYKYVINHLGLLKLHRDNNLYKHIPEKVNHLPILTFEQFETLILKKENNMENKEITHYIIKQKLWGLDGQEWRNGDKLYSTNGKSLSYFQKLGILNNPEFFEPIYKSKEKIVSVGGKFNVTIKDGKVFHKNDDITNFVRELIATFHNRNMYIDNYQAVVEDVTFSKTGCQNNITKLSDWKKVYNALN